MLGVARAAVFSKRAVLRAPINTPDTCGNLGMVSCRREPRAVDGRRDAIGAGEARGEGPHALQADGEADLSNRMVGASQQRCGALEAPGEQISMWGLAEGAPELAAEVGSGETGGARQVLHAERLEVPGVGEVLGAQQVASWWSEADGWSVVGRWSEGHETPLSRRDARPGNPRRGDQSCWAIQEKIAREWVMTVPSGSFSADSPGCDGRCSYGASSTRSRRYLRHARRALTRARSSSASGTRIAAAINRTTSVTTSTRPASCRPR
jgi:hypothetical protein